MSIFNLSAYDKALKIKYANKLSDLTFDDTVCPFAHMVKRDPTFSGKAKTINAMVAHSSGSSDFAAALASKGVATLREFQITTSNNYHIGSIDEKTIAASRDTAGALASVTDTAVLEGTKSFGKALSHQIWGNGGGARGRIASGGISTDTVTLTEEADLVKFEIGMQIELASDDGSGSSPAGVRSGSPLIVESIDEDSLQVTFTTNVTANYAGAVANDYLFRRGDYDNVMQGVLSWIPVTAPSGGDSFFGVDRSIHISRLAGRRLSATGSDMIGAVYDSLAKGTLAGGVFDTLFLGPLHYAALEKQLESKVEVPVSTNTPGIGFNAISFNNPRGGQIKVVQDLYCPDAYGLLTKMSDWELWTMGPAPHFAMSGGGRFAREVAADAVEFRMRGWWQLVNKDQKNNVLLTWGS